MGGGDLGTGSLLQKRISEVTPSGILKNALLHITLSIVSSLIFMVRRRSLSPNLFSSNFMIKYNKRKSYAESVCTPKMCLYITINNGSAFLLSNEL